MNIITTQTRLYQEINKLNLEQIGLLSECIRVIQSSEDPRADLVEHFRGNQDFEKQFEKLREFEQIAVLRMVDLAKDFTVTLTKVSADALKRM